MPIYAWRAVASAKEGRSTRVGFVREQAGGSSLQLTYSISSRRGEDRLRQAPTLQSGVRFLQLERRIATLLQFFAGETPASTAVELMHRKPVMIDAFGGRTRPAQMQIGGTIAKCFGKL